MGFFVITGIILLLMAVGFVGGRLFAAENKEVNGDPGSGNFVAFGSLIGGLVLLFIVVVLSSTATIENGHIGVVKQFGAVVDSTGDGFVTKMPWQSLSEVSVQNETRQYNMTDEGDNHIGAAVSSDTQPIFINMVVDYSLQREDAVDLFKKTGGAYIERKLDPLVPQITKEVTSQYKAVDVAKNRGEITRKIHDGLNALLEPQGIKINVINIPNFTPTRELSQAIEQTVVAEQNARQAQAQVAVKEAEARQAAAVAKGEADANRNRAKGEADAVTLKAQAEANKIRLEGRALAANPQILRKLAIEKLNPQVQMIVPEDSTLVQGVNGPVVNP